MTPPTVTELRQSRVSWPIPNSVGHPSCPLCGLSAFRFRGDPGEREAKLEAHIRRPHARCRACFRVVAAHRMANHRKRWHRFPTLTLPGFSDVA